MRPAFCNAIERLVCGQWILRRKQGKRASCCNGGIELLRIAQRANQAVMRLDVVRVRSDCFAEGMCCAHSIAGGQQIYGVLRPLFCRRSRRLREIGHIVIVSSGLRSKRVKLAKPMKHLRRVHRK